MKPGFKTTEFWLTVAVTLLKLQYPDMPDEAMWTTASYVLARGAVKATALAKK